MKLWSKLGSVVLFILGLIPYIGIGYLVVQTWDKTFGYLSLIDIHNIWRAGWYPISTVAYLTRYIFECLALLGSWAFWWIFCKAFKYLVI